MMAARAVQWAAAARVLAAAAACSSPRWPALQLRQASCSQPLRARWYSAASRSNVQAESLSASAADPSTWSVDVSDACAARLRALNERKPELGDRALRVFVSGGEGCHGFSYHFELTAETPKEDDRTFTNNGSRVLIDELSLEYLTGCTIDYKMELVKAAFAVQDNPNAEAGCSCGISFSPKL